MGFKYQEYRVRYNFGPIASEFDATWNPREAGNLYHKFRGAIAGSGPGEVVMERRMVAVEDWVEVEKTEFTEKGPIA